MAQPLSTTDQFRALIVLFATAAMIVFNWMGAAGYVNGITQLAIWDRFPTVLTPAAYAFSIWTLVYAGLVGFSVYQLLPKHLSRFRSIRSLYILSCALNGSWIFFWQGAQLAICLAVAVALLAVLVLVNARVKNADTVAESLLVKGTFGLYLGCILVAALGNLAVFLAYGNISIGPVGGAVLILLAAAFGVLVRVKFTNYFAPLAVAWGLTAIAVKQGEKTAVVAAAAVGVIACLIASLSFVVNLPSSDNRREPGGQS